MSVAADPRAIERIARANERRDAAFAVLGLLVLFVALLVLTALFVDLLIDGWPRLNWEFLTGYPSRFAHRAGILPAIVGTFAVMLVTAAAAVPVGVLSGVYLEEYAPRNWLTTVIEININNLAGVPSIIYGLLALGLLVHQFRLGESILAAGITLALLILPMIIVATREALRAIPSAVREAVYALGATKWQVMWHHILPYSTGGILTGVIMGLARAIGETAPVITIGALTFIAFLPDPPFKAEFPFVSFEWLTAPFTVMPIQMFNWVSRPQAAFAVNAAAAGVVLIVMTLAMNAAAIVIRNRFRRRVRW
ncbi:phosphate ABC transporter permease PstA [Inmirania thermothiophila]|uniref:Phosphate transport system permease protein PstA n=1 Tax=Inmirania thermothiophila TaxID=1750597 RepID=A0A3N1Y8I6_9GAMM|nr:phosphate ABC transporter permease PstA [Inmirania thermothiophila]ROR35129.1 phosphate ABC transporter membrane protein 2 (PhoT family) [Inmirania thermothiophila]